MLPIIANSDMLLSYIHANSDSLPIFAGSLQAAMSQTGSSNTSSAQREQEGIIKKCLDRQLHVACLNVGNQEHRQSGQITS